MNLVYFVRPGEANEELRYSLRSVEANLPVESVSIVGYCPSWVTGVQLIQGNRFGGDKMRNVYDNVRIIAEAPDLPDEVVVMNDDFFIREPTTGFETCYRSTLREHIFGLRHLGSWWAQSLRATYCWLRDEHGIDEPLSYELHRPLPIVRALMAETLQAAADYQPENPPQWRSLYGNLHTASGGQQVRDGKVHRAHVVPTGAFLSTDDTNWTRSETGHVVREMFPTPSAYERTSTVRGGDLHGVLGLPTT